MKPPGVAGVTMGLPLVCNCENFPISGMIIHRITKNLFTDYRLSKHGDFNREQPGPDLWR